MDTEKSTEQSETSPRVDEAFNRAAYLEDIRRLRSFDLEPVLWPAPIRPRWKN